MASRALVGRASSYQGVSAPIRLPSRLVIASFARLSASPLLSFLWSRFLVVFPVGWLCAAHRYRPAFLDSLCARYAQRCIICSRRGGSCARLTVRRCCAGRAVVCGVSARVGVGFVWRSARLRAGRVSVSLVFFFEETTMPERGGTKGAHPGSTRMLLNERTIRHHKVMNVDVPVQERCGSREGQ